MPASAPDFDPFHREELPRRLAAGSGALAARGAQRLRSLAFRLPGDVALHYGDTMHAAPPPERDDLEVYRVSAVTGYAGPEARPHRGRHYNEVLHGREDGQVEHLARVAERSRS